MKQQPVNNQPKAYQQGWIEFYKLKFKVTPDVLIPRPETELLVDEVLKNIKGDSALVLDIGCGSGNIAISIAKNSKDVHIIATDISQKALEIAKINAKLHGVSNKIIFLKSNLLCFHLGGGRLKKINLEDISIIVANLPYIPSERINYLDSSVKDFEPHIALDGGKDGFELYRKLFQQIQKFSLPPREWKPKLIIGEIDYTHGEIAIQEAQKYFPQAEVEVRKDLSYLQRILVIRY